MAPAPALFEKSLVFQHQNNHVDLVLLIFYSICFILSCLIAWNLSLRNKKLSEPNCEMVEQSGWPSCIHICVHKQVQSRGCLPLSYTTAAVLSELSFSCSHQTRGSACKTKRYKNSFISAAVCQINTRKKLWELLVSFYPLALLSLYIISCYMSCAVCKYHKYVKADSLQSLHECTHKVTCDLWAQNSRQHWIESYNIVWYSKSSTVLAYIILYCIIVQTDISTFLP